MDGDVFKVTKCVQQTGEHDQDEWKSLGEFGDISEAKAMCAGEVAAGTQDYHLRITSYFYTCDLTDDFPEDKCDTCEGCELEKGESRSYEELKG